MTRAIRVRKAIFRGSSNRPKHCAKVVRERARLERQPSDYTQTATTATLETPEQVWMRAGIGDPYGAIGGDYFGFDCDGGVWGGSLEEAPSSHGTAFPPKGGIPSRLPLSPLAALPLIVGPAPSLYDGRG